MIRADHLSFGYSFGSVLEDVSFSVGENVKVGLVGPNGAGKSTLFKLLKDEEAPIAGKLEISGRLGHVPQEIHHDPVMDSAATVRAYIDPEQKKADHELRTMLNGLELAVSLTESPRNFSGGQKTKLAILRALIDEPDILLLDEPTNFLDVAGKQWIMNFLSQYPKTLLMVSHDLKLLDDAISKVIVINPLTKKIEEYKGNYTTFVKLKKQQDELLKRQIINEQKHIKHMEEGLRKMARFTSKKGVRQRTMLKRRIEKLKENLPELPKEIRRIKLILPEPVPTGEIPISAKHITKLFDDELILADVSFSLRKNERVAIIGPNGAGKSTFIKILIGLLTPDDGAVERDPKLSIGYYSQGFETFDFEKTVYETVDEKIAWGEGKLRQYLARFNFLGDRVSQQVGTLSGGEKTRLAIALLLLDNPNLLILDEPTTYLDVLSQRVILDALKTYTGAMLFVSHTEAFVEELQPSRVLLLPENKIEYWVPELREAVGII